MGGGSLAELTMPTHEGDFPLPITLSSTQDTTLPPFDFMDIDEGNINTVPSFTFTPDSTPSSSSTSFDPNQWFK